MMKKRSNIILTLAAAACLALTGCDYIRSALDKPTSADLELLRAARERKAAETALPVGAAPADTLPSAVESELQATETADGTAAVDIPVTGGPYYVVMGSFMEEENAGKLQAQLAQKGLASEVIPIRKFTIVGVGGFDTAEAARRQIPALKAFSKSPQDLWVYRNNK